MPDEYDRPYPIEKGGINKGCRERPQTPPPTDKYKEGWDRIWGDKSRQQNKG